MAKKQTAEQGEKPEKTGKPAPAEGTAEAPVPKKEKKPREPKAKTSPDAPTASPAPEAAPAPKAPVARPASTPGGEAKKRKKQPGHGPPMGKKLKNHLQNLKDKFAKGGPLPLKQAIGMLKQAKRSKFDETVEVHMSLGIDTSQNDQLVRGSVPLPHGIGKAVRVVVFCQGENIAKAKEAGADHTGGAEIIQKIQTEGWLDFDVALATQDMMGQVSRLGKVLGPRGLMPTPKAGTVITAGADVAAAVREFKAGKVEYRADKGGNIHAGVGKMSFDEDKLIANITVFVEQVRHAKPTAVKGNYVNSITLSATMSPSIPIIV